jgi:uncharacterized protein (DUF305 family)
VIVAGACCVAPCRSTTITRHEDETLRTRTPLRAFAAAATTTLVLAACGQGTDDTTTDDPTAAEAPSESGTEEDTEANEADVAFVQQMIPHHEGAIEMAELVHERTERTELRELADGIVEVQDAEITQLEGMLERFGADRMMMGDEDGQAMDHDAMGMMTETEMAELQEAEGEEFDRRFIELMIDHHQGAIDMSERVLAEGSDPEVAGLAEAIIAAQEAEIDQMRGWLDEWDLS